MKHFLEFILAMTFLGGWLVAMFLVIAAVELTRGIADIIRHVRMRRR